MAFNFSPALDDAISRIRQNIGDTVEGAGCRPVVSNTNFPDETIDALLLARTGNEVSTTATLFEILQSEWSRFATVEKRGFVSQDATQVMGMYEGLAKEWRRKPKGRDPGWQGQSSRFVKKDAYTEV